MKKGSEINKECFSISSFPSLSLDYWTQIRIYEWIEIRCIISSEFSEITQKGLKRVWQNKGYSIEQELCMTRLDWL